MSDYQQYLKERDLVDYYLQKGYLIKNSTENLSGAFVLFEKKNSNGEMERETIQLLTPAARKYFSVRVIQQQNAQPERDVGA
ncbi:hypothetical protein L1999_10500 [Neobacillus drentensis]|uniref:hypothetical protein n=1 Tax=Neobacillus drentensis TaxID=220684 RepID=UPI001F48FEE2|nr:hypothetical protein [Neobacillus drentensis]ULT58921.1 hypothetical protein L1999_10500 [Neobacillus drentensis]